VRSLVPVAVKRVTREIDGRQLGVGYLDILGYFFSSNSARNEGRLFLKLPANSAIAAQFLWTSIVPDSVPNRGCCKQCWQTDFGRLAFVIRDTRGRFACGSARGIRTCGFPPASRRAFAPWPEFDAMHAVACADRGTTCDTRPSSRVAPARHAADTLTPLRSCPVRPSAVRRSRLDCTPFRVPARGQQRL
jgi:hypothetical protein